jgi:threonylcarbamoyladenosine tRNA methylthiotransferase MtaB
MEIHVSRGSVSIGTDRPADVSVINTCTVTGRSDYRSRQLVRRVRKLNEDTIVIVTGCYAQNNPEAAASIPDVDMVVGNAAKLRLPDLVERRNGRPRVSLEPLDRIYEEGSRVRGRMGGRTRAFLKIQDGCNQACAYCAVRIARGPSRSRPWPSILDEAQAALETGYREIVLTGINLGSYGRDLGRGMDLSDVVERLAGLPGMGRIRLSSVEPQEMTDRLIALAAEHPKVCRHLHLPLQSGSDPVLSRMNRAYAAQEYDGLVRRIAERIPGCGLGADVIVGFPGETEEDVRRTCDLISGTAISYLHVFSYSPRPGTPAENLGPAVPGTDKKDRSRTLRTLGVDLSMRFRTEQVGRTLPVLFESAVGSGRLSGLADNYLRVEAEADRSWINRFAEVEITQVTESGAVGRLQAHRNCGEAGL